MGKKWSRDRYTGPGGGLYAGPGGGLDRFSGGGANQFNGGGLDRFNGGGLDPSPGGGLYEGPCAYPYMSNTPPMHIFIPKFRTRGFNAEADVLAQAHGLQL